MKKIKFFTASILFGLFFSGVAQVDKTNAEKRNSENDLIEITPFIEVDIWLYDTTKENSSECPRHPPMEVFPSKFLNQKGFNLLTNQLKQTYNDPNTLIYSDPESKLPASLKERKRLIIKCDSIESVSIRFKGKTYANKALNYDSTTFWKNVDIVKFFESWYYNKRTGEIVKKQLGYAIVKFHYDKGAFRVWYYYFNSKESREKVLKNW